MKKCIRCKSIKEEVEFNKNKQNLDGLSSWCRVCRHDRYIETKDRVLEQGKEWFDNNKEKANARSRNWRSRNKEKIRAEWKVKEAIRQKKLIRPEACSICDSVNKNIQGHHPDYSKPLEVIWVCPECHWKLDRKQECRTTK